MADDDESSESRVEPPPEGLRRRFKLRRVLGFGGMGAVFLGTLPSTGKPCAVKVVKRSSNDKHLARLRREAMLLSRVRHPNLIEVYDAGSEEGTPWVAMELVEGRTLSQAIRERWPREVEWIENVFAGASSAVAALHHAGILHRDLKPANIMIDEFDRPVVMDLGLAWIEDATRLTQRGHVVGTVAYLAPEVFLGSAATPESDWYSMGVSLYRVLEGKVPYGNSEVFAMVGRRRWTPPPAPVGPHRHHRLARLALGLMDADPKVRSAHVKTLLGTLRSKSVSLPLSGIGAAGPSLSVSLRMHRPGFAGNRQGALAILAALVLAGVAAVMVRSSVPRAPAPEVVLVAAPPASPAGARADAARPAAPGAAPDPSMPEATAEPSAWLRWIRQVREEAGVADRAGARASAHRLRRRLLEALRLRGLFDPEAKLLAFDLACELSLAGGPRPARVWVDRAARLLAAAREGRGAADLTRLEAAGRRLEELAARSPEEGSGLDPLPAGPPGKQILWQLRSWTISEMPERALVEMAGFGYGLPPGFDLEKWAGDLADHPLVVLARLRSGFGLVRRIEDDDLLRRLERVRTFAPPARRGGPLFKVWFELGYTALVQQALRVGVDPGELERRRTDLAAGMAGANLDRELRTVLEAWLGVVADWRIPGSGRRYGLPLAARIPDLREAMRRLAEVPREAPDAAFRQIMALEAGYLWFFHHHLLLDCEAAERALYETRARVDWEVLAEAGAGGLLRDGLSLDHQGEVVPDIEFCRGSRAAYRQGPPFRMIHFLDAAPAALE